MYCIRIVRLTSEWEAFTVVVSELGILLLGNWAGNPGNYRMGDYVSGASRAYDGMAGEKCA